MFLRLRKRSDQVLAPGWGAISTPVVSDLKYLRTWGLYLFGIRMSRPCLSFFVEKDRNDTLMNFSGR